MDETRAASWLELQDALPLGLRLPWRARRRRRTRADACPARRRGAHAGGSPAAQLPQVRSQERGPGRLGVELAGAGQAPWPADPPARLVVLTLRRAPFRHGQLDAYDSDGVVWMVDYVRARELAPAPLRAAASRRERTSSRLSRDAKHRTDQSPGTPDPPPAADSSRERVICLSRARAESAAVAAQDATRA